MNGLTHSGVGAESPASMTSKEIGDLCGKRHDNARRTIETLAETGVITLPQFEEVPNTGPGPKTIMVYVFKGEQGKRDSIVVIAQLSPEFTAALVDRWQEIEKHIARPSGVIDMRDSSQLRIATIQLIEMNQEKDDKIALLTPKAEAHDLLAASEGSLTFTQAAKLLGVKQDTMTKWMNANGWIYRQNGSWVAYRQHIMNGRLEYKEHSYTSQTTGMQGTKQYCHITQKGLAKLAIIFGGEMKNAA